MTETKAELLFDLPDEPVDGHELRFFLLEVWGDEVSITAVTFTYHVSTPWAKYSPDGPGGADLVDTWMIKHDGHTVGRNPGWESWQRIGTNRHFLAYSEVREAGVAYLTERIARCQKTMAQMVRDRDTLKDSVALEGKAQ